MFLVTILRCFLAVRREEFIIAASRNHIMIKNMIIIITQTMYTIILVIHNCVI